MVHKRASGDKKRTRSQIVELTNRKLSDEHNEEIHRGDMHQGWGANSNIFLAEVNDTDHMFEAIVNTAQYFSNGGLPDSTRAHLLCGSFPLAEE